MKKLPLSTRLFFLSAAFSAAFPLTALSAIETVTYGNFEISYFGNGDSDSVWGYTSSLDWTNEMKSGVERSLNYWNSVITTQSASTIKIACLWDASLDSGALGGAESEYYYNGATGVTLTATEAIWRDGISESDVSDFTYSNYAATVLLSTTASFYYGESVSEITYNQWDFQSMFTHEIGHAMGINSSCGSNGWEKSLELSYGTKSEDVLQASTFDTLLVTKDESGNYNRVITESSEKTILDTVQLEAAAYSTGTEYALALDEAGTLSNLRVYNPSGFEEGSSMSHFDSADALMYKSLNNGEIRRELLDDELLLLSAMGWSVIPEPSAFGLLAGMLALALCATRRKRKKV